MQFDYVFRKYIFPVQFVIGNIGNVLNLIVLNSRGMRTKTNCFLSAMAVADLGFFLAMCPIYMVSKEKMLSLSSDHQRFYFHLHIPLTAFANWFSAASIWLTIGVTVERLIAIKCPLLARTYWKKSHIIIFIVLVYAMALVFSLYHFAWRVVEPEWERNNTVNGSIDFNSTVSNRRIGFRWRTPDPNNDDDWLRYWYVHVSHGWAAVTVVALPLVMLIILSSCLVYYLRLNTHAVQGLRAGSALLRRGERRVTWTVVVLIAAFTLFNFPSGVYAVIEIGFHKSTAEEKKAYPWFFELAEIVNALVCTNKAVNFGLYCGASSGFRRKLLSLITRHRFCGRVVRTLSGRFSVSSGNGDCNGVAPSTATCKYSFMTTVFHETRCCNGDQNPRYHQQHEQWALCRVNGHVFLQRRAQSIDVNARSRQASTTLLHLQQLQQQPTPLIPMPPPPPMPMLPSRSRTCSAL